MLYCVCVHMCVIAGVCWHVAVISESDSEQVCAAEAGGGGENMHQFINDRDS